VKGKVAGYLTPVEGSTIGLRVRVDVRAGRVLVTKRIVLVPVGNQTPVVQSIVKALHLLRFQKGDLSPGS
jgi:hypothetical protein